MPTRVEIEWAMRYGVVGRLAPTPNELHRILAPAREEYKATYKVPGWCGVELLRAWAYLLGTIDRAAGGGTLGHEWRSVLEAVRKHPAVRPSDLPPGVDPDAVTPPSEFSAKPQRHGEKDGAFLEAKLQRLREPHVAPINDLVDEIRTVRGTFQVPYVDPDSGGIASRVLVAFESPVILMGDSGLQSADNKDAAAKLVWQAYRSTGLPRSAALQWNVVPWFLGQEGKDETALASHLVEAQPWVDRLLALLPDVRAVVAVGAWTLLGLALSHEVLGARGIEVIPAPVPRQADPASVKEFDYAFARARHLAER